MFGPEQWVYTNGSDITGQPRLGVAVVHVPTCTTIYIDARGSDKTRTIMRAELVAMYTALDSLSKPSDIAIQTQGLTALNTITITCSYYISPIYITSHGKHMGGHNPPKIHIR